MTATATISDEKKISDLCDMRDPFIYRSSPVTKNHLYFKVRRPPSMNGFRGNNSGKPSTLGLLQLLVLDRFVSCFKDGEETKVTMIFVQSFIELNIINNFLLVKLHKHLRGRAKPWMTNHSAVGKLTKEENQKRIEAGEIKLFITTSVMMCGIDLPRVDMIIIARPYGNISSIIQAGGRGGRIQKDETRRRVVVYLLFNATDIRKNAPNMSDAVRMLYESNGCLKSILNKHFTKNNANPDSDKKWCCDVHFYKD